MLKRALMLSCAVLPLLAVQAQAGDIVLSIEAGISAYGNSGVSTVDRLERDEIATTHATGVSIGYQDTLWGGRWRGLLGAEHTDADGDWGVFQTNGDLARQTVQIASTSLILGAEYDFKQVGIGDLYPFIGGGVRLNLNRPENGTLIELASGGESGCLSDNSSTTSLGYHGLAGVGYDAGPWTIRTFYQYTDRGDARTSGDGCPTGYDGYTVNLKDHSVRLRLSYAF
jgi:hypothetical protein